MRYFISILTILLVFSCSTTRNSKHNLSIEDEEVNLYAFIGKKVRIEEFDPNENTDTKEIDAQTGDTIIRRRFVMDNAFNAEYVVLQNVFNKVASDTVAFKAYDHYGRPGFEKYEYLLLYISRDSSGAFYHQKYQFDPLIKKGDAFYGQEGQSIKHLFEQRKKTVFKARNIFK